MKPVSGLIAATLCVLTSMSPPLLAAPLPQILVVSNRADLVSGGDALVEIKWPAGSNPAFAKIALNGRPLVGVFAARPNGKYMGLVTGLVNGDNILTARVPGAGSQITITNYPLGGPIFAGAQQQPWVCATLVSQPVTVTIPGTSLSATVSTRASGLGSDPLDEQCNAAPLYSYYYMPKALEGTDCVFAVPTTTNRCFEPFPSLNNPATRPPDADIANFTNDRGQVSKAILRVERGAIDRGIYQLAVMYDPAESIAPWTPPKGWNQKVLWTNGGSTGQSRFQTAPGSSVFIDFALRRGYMVVASMFTEHGTQSDITLGAELMTMLKERVTEQYGPIRFTMGYGCSGGTQIQTATASAYPGLFDGVQATCSFPDSASVETEVQDCSLLNRYFYNTAAGSALTTDKRTAINGNIPGFCNSYLGFDPLVGDPTRAANCGSGWPAALTYDKALRPNGVRCSELDHNAPQVGTFVDVDGVVKGNRQLDNVGVQYGLQALQAGTITPEDFVVVNEGIGGYDNEWVWVPGKREAATDISALSIWYRAGLVSDGRQLAKTPIIDTRGQNNVNGDVHENWRAWQTRARLDTDFGSHGSQVIWAFTGAGGSPPPLTSAIALRSFLGMDQWLTNIESDTSSASREQKVVSNRPSNVVDMCFATNGVTEPLVDVGLDSPACPVKPGSTPRRVAGEPITRAIFKCNVKPLNFADPDYAGVVFDAGQRARLQAVFGSSGVCDWTKPGVGQVVGEPWTTFKDGPGGKPLGDPPAPAPIP